MPYKLVDPKPGRSPYYRIRGTEHHRYVNVTTGTANRREAEAFLRSEREEAKRLSIPGAKSAVTFDEAAKAYVSAGGEDRFLIPILLRIGQTKVTDLDQAAIDACAVAAYPNATAATRNRQVYSPISAILRHNGIAVPIRRPKGAAGKPRTAFLQPKEAFALLDAAKAVHPRFGALLTFLLYTGARLSEALRLKWDDVDLERATATLKETKNGNSITVHVPSYAIAALGQKSDTGRCFRLTKSGRLYHLWAETERQAGLSFPPRSAFHILRHTHATWRRLHTGADTSALVQTGLWKSRNAAAIYEHIDASAEAKKSDLLPTPKRAKTVRRSRKPK